MEQIEVENKKLQKDKGDEEDPYDFDYLGASLHPHEDLPPPRDHGTYTDQYSLLS